jgi:hypothetical protein
MTIGKRETSTKSTSRKMNTMKKIRRRTITASACAIGALALIGPSGALAADCDNFSPNDMDPTIPTFKQWADANGVANNTLGGFSTGTTNRHTTQQLVDYQNAIAQATVSNPRVKVITRNIGTSNLGKPFQYAVVGTPDNINNLDSGRNDGAFWRGVREGTISAEEGEAQADERPALIWLTATPHGSEPAAGEALSRLLYEFAARRDCHNIDRLANMDTFIMPVTNPDGRDPAIRTTAYGFDPNRDFATRNQDVNQARGDEIFKYPGPIYVDAHQQTSGYFFPPNEDAVHHEVSEFSWKFIQNDIGPALQQTFNDQTSQYRNYNSYDLFAMVYGDSVPSVQLGAAGMTFEKGTSEAYGKQVYDHYLALDETANVVSRDKADIMSDWSEQWAEAEQQGEEGFLPQNHLVSPLNPTIIDQPDTDVFGYYYLPDSHSGDTAKLMRDLLRTGVHVYRLDAPVNVPAAHTFGPPGSSAKTLPAGTLWIPSGQTNKHWIQAILGEDPFMPVSYHYDVVNWSWSQQRGQSGNGYLTEAMPGDPAMTEITSFNPGGVTDGSKPVLAFPTDSAAGLGMVVDLSSQGVTVSRSDTAFDSGGIHYPTGTALVDTSTLGSVDINAISLDRKVPVHGLDAYPTARHQLPTTKIGLYTGNTAVPTNPLQPGTGTGHCGSVNNTTFPGSSNYCEMLNVLAVQMKFPLSVIQPVTSTDLAAGNLISQNFTAFINPGQTIGAGPGATALQAFVNNGGNYVGSLAGGTTTARNAGFTNLNTSSTSGAPWNDPCPSPQGAALDTSGVSFMGEFDTTNPVAWGFDTGGFLYRDATSNPVYNPATLAGTPSTIPDTNAAIKYPDPLTAFGYTCNATSTGELPGRPAVGDSAFGSGHATMLGFNPWYRSWIDENWRMALNGALYPNGASIPAGPSKKVADATEPAKAPIAKSELPQVTDRPVVPGRDPAVTDIRIVSIKGAHMRGLHRILRKADVPARIANKARFTKEAGKGVLTIKGERIGDQELRPKWQLDLGQNARDSSFADTNI